MKAKSLFTVLVGFLPIRAVCEEPVYGIFSLPDYEIDGSTANQVFRGWDFRSVTIPESPGGGLEAVTVAHSLVDLPGVDASRRGANTIEPSIRGLGGDRVTTFFNGLQLPGGSPTHVAPVGFFFPGSVATITAGRAFPSVTGGPVSTSGRIDLDSPGLTEQPGSGLMAVTARSGWEGINAIASGVWKGSGTQAYGALTGAWFDDYRTGGGDLVDADVQTVGAAGSVVWTGDRGHSANLAFVVNRQILVRNASLPLDLKDTPMMAVTLDTAWKTDPATWKARIGYTDTRPFLTSEDRPKLAPVPIDLVTSDAKAANLAGAISRESSVGTAGTLEMGVDLSSQNRDSVRTRFMTSGAQLYDHIWPEVESTHAGLFGELRWDEPDRYRVVGGVRLDRTWSDALAADDPVVGTPGARGDTIRENYGAFNGPDAVITKRDSWTGTAQVLFEAPVGSKTMTWYAGAGVIVAPPGTSERYRAFLTALGGGVEVGNPSLDSETRWELDLGIRMRGEGWRLDVGGFLARIDGFIQREAIASGPLVYGFRNRDVQLAGVELISEWAPSALAERGFSLDGSLGVVWGENRETSAGIPEIPPWNLRLGMAWESGEEIPRYRLSLGTRIVGSQSNPNPASNPLYRDTEGFMLWRLGGRIRLGSGWTLDLSAENIFDQRYYEYLQAPVAVGAFGPSSGTLENGDSVPGFGRQVILSVRKQF